MTFDAYLHLGTPRFQSLDDAIALMDESGVERALVCAFDTNPDLRTLHDAITRHPNRFLAAGLPLGRNRAESEKGIDAQFEAGFAGLRISDVDVAERPWILDRIAEHDGFALVCGEGGLATAAHVLLSHLESSANALVIAGHFAGATTASVLDDPVVSELFGHDRFLVNFSRHGAWPNDVITPWAAAVLDRVGWERSLWASEAPILYWRNETLADALTWIDRFEPSALQRAAFFGETADRRLWNRPRHEAAPLKLTLDLDELTRHRPAQFWPSGVELRDELPARLVAGWRAWGGPARGRLNAFLDEVLDEALP